MDFLFASQNVPTGVIKYINSSYKTRLSLSISASYCSKASFCERMTWQYEIFLSEGSFGSVLISQAARLTSLQHRGKLILAALSSDVWSTGLLANPCYPFWFNREESDVILSLISTGSSNEFSTPKEYACWMKLWKLLNQMSKITHRSVEPEFFSIKFRSFPGWKRTSGWSSSDWLGHFPIAYMNNKRFTSCWL